MANGATTPSRLGQENGTGDVNKLFLKVFSGEILTTFDETTVMKELHTIRTIKNGKSAQFPVAGTATASYHTPGENIADAGAGYLSTIKHGEKVITIDDMLIASSFISNIDELKNHYDLRSVYAKELGKALAYRFDEATIKTLIAASYATSEIGGQDGEQVTGLDTADVTSIIAKIFEAAQKLDEHDVPSDSRYAIITPALYYKLLTADNVAINKDTTNAGNADVGKGTLMEIAGISLKVSNRLAGLQGNTGNAGDNGQSNDIFGDDGTGYTPTANIDAPIVVAHPSAIGTVKLLDLATESEYQIERQGTLFVAKYLMGHGILRPEASVVITDA